MITFRRIIEDNKCNSNNDYVEIKVTDQGGGLSENS